MSEKSKNNDIETNNQDEKKTMLKDRIPSPVIGILSILLGLVVSLVFILITGGLLKEPILSIRNTAWYLLFPIIILTIISAILVYKAIVQKIRGLIILVIFSILSTLMFVLQAIDIKNIGEGLFERASGGYIIEISDALMPVIMLVLYMHVELMRRDTPHPIRGLISFGTGIPMFVLAILKLFYHDSEVLQTSINYYFYAFGVASLFISIFALYNFYQVFYYSDTKEVEIPSIITLTGVTIMIFSFVLRPFTDTLNFGFEFQVFNTWLFSIAIFIVVLAYVLYPKYSYALPFNAYELLVINEAGITLYSRIFELPEDVTEDELPDEMLKSPALVALSTLVKEITAAKGELSEIILSDRCIILRNQGEVFSILIADHTSYFVKFGLASFMKDFSALFEKEIKEFIGDIEVFRKTDEILERYFPFARL